jgi:hypothetical protein
MLAKFWISVFSFNLGAWAMMFVRSLFTRVAPGWDDIISTFIVSLLIVGALYLFGVIS